MVKKKVNRRKADDVVDTPISPLPDAPCPSSILLDATPTLDNGHITAQCMITDKQSPQGVRELLVELVEQRHRERHRANDEATERALALVEEKFTANAAKLATKHANETDDLEDAKFKFFEEFDERREAWRAASRVNEKLLAEETLKYTALVKSLAAKKMQEDVAENKALLETIKNLPSYYPETVQWDNELQRYFTNKEQRVEYLRERTTASRRERQRAHTELIASHEVAWTARQLELRNQASFRKEQRKIRLRFEGEYQARLSKLNQDEKALKLRQTKELMVLSEEREASLADIRANSMGVELDVAEERSRVDRWWRCHAEEAAAHLQRIEEDEKRARENSGRLESAGSSEGMHVAAKETSLEHESQTATVQQHTPTTDTAELETYPSNLAVDKPRVFALDQGLDADTHEDEPISGSIQAPTPAFIFNCSFPTNVYEAANGLGAPPLVVREPDPLPIDKATTASTDSPTFHFGLPMKNPAPSYSKPPNGSVHPFISSETDPTSIVQKRSGSPDSIDSEFVSEF